MHDTLCGPGKLDVFEIASTVGDRHIACERGMTKTSSNSRSRFHAITINDAHEGNSNFCADQIGVHGKWT